LLLPGSQHGREECDFVFLAVKGLEARQQTIMPKSVALGV